MLPLPISPQWRNSYGLRVGKPAGCPFTLVLHLKLPFDKGHHLEKGNFSTALCNTFFHSLVAKFSYRCIPYDDEIKIIWVPRQLEPMGERGPSLSQKARVPFTQMFQLRLPFEKGAPFQHFCFSFFGCEILITMHEIRIIWVPLQLGPRGEKIHICKIGSAAQIVGFKTHIHKKKQNKTKQKQQLQGAPSL